MRPSHYSRTIVKRRVSRRSHKSVPSYSSTTRERNNTTNFEKLDGKLPSINNKRRDIVKSIATAKAKAKSILASEYELEGNSISPSTNKITDDVNNEINQRNNGGSLMMRATSGAFRSIGNVAQYE